jgi:phosphatidylethanolamine/phosphatidyl-N-methylethanolamine N-methyltransferase
MRASPQYEASYIDSYDINNTDRTLAGSFLQKSHELLERTISNGYSCEKILELGAGTGHHFPHVRHKFGQYIMTDANEDMLKIASQKYAKEMNAGVLCVDKQNATATTFPNHSFDRLIATHVLEHLPNPVSVLTEWNRIVKPGGLISIALPCDPGMLWRLGRHFGPRRNAVNRGMAYDYLQATEHINPIFNLLVFIRHHFESIEESWYPAMLPFPDLNLFYICHIRT